MPAATHIEKEGTFTNTQRLLQWRDKALEPPGGRALRPVVHAPPGQARDEALRELDRGPRLAAAATSSGTTPSTGRRDEPSAEAVLKEMNGYRVDDGEPVSLFTDARGRRRRPRAACGSTPACSPTASTRPAGATPATWTPRAAGCRRSGAGRGRPTAACSTTARPPTPTASRGRSARSTSGGTRSEGKWTGYDVPDFPADKRPDYRADDDAQGHGRDRRRRPVHHDGRRPGLAVLAERPARRPAADALRAVRVAAAEPALPRPRLRPGQAHLAAAGEPVQPDRRPALPARRDDVPADRAPHGRAR